MVACSVARSGVSRRYSMTVGASPAWRSSAKTLREVPQRGLCQITALVASATGMAISEGDGLGA